MAVLSLSEFPKLKEALAPFGYTIHVHDACGGQAFELEPTTDSPDAKAYEVLEDFFTGQRMTLHFFGNDKLNFIAK